MSDDRVQRALEKRAQRTQRESQNHQLNGLAGETRQQRRVAFLANFSDRGHQCIEPAFRRIEKKIDDARTVGEWSDDVGAPDREVSAKVTWATDEDQIELMLFCSGRHAILAFRADPLKLMIEVSQGGVVPGRLASLRLDQITDAKIDQVADDFVEQALEVL